MRPMSADRSQLEPTVRDADLNGTSGALIRRAAYLAGPFFCTDLVELSVPALFSGYFA